MWSWSAIRFLSSTMVRLSRQRVVDTSYVSSSVNVTRNQHRRKQNFTMEGVTIQPKNRIATKKAYSTHTQCRCAVSLISNWTHTHTHPFNGPLSGTTWVSRYQKGKNQSRFYWSKKQWVAVASAGPYASLHLAPDRFCCRILCSKILSTTFIACSNNRLPLTVKHILIECTNLLEILLEIFNSLFFYRFVWICQQWWYYHFFRDVTNCSVC